MFQQNASTTVIISIFAEKISLCGYISPREISIRCKHWDNKNSQFIRKPQVDRFDTGI